MGQAKVRAKRTGRPSLVEAERLTEHIVEVAARFFLEQGFDATSIDQIAAAAKISKRTLYARFPTKADLFEAVIVTAYEASIRSMEKAERKAGTTQDRLYALSLSLWADLSTAESIARDRLVIAEAVRFPHMAQIMNNAGVQRAAQIVEHILLDGIAAGEIRQLDARFAAEQFFNAVLLGARQRVLIGLEPPELTYIRKRQLQRSVELFLHGCGSGKA
ncbi:TetR/AcrR family transcriptional regulator [Microvirga arsenatis]|uniref:TetR family transcriptional regulator n=1 Tax=Microvirga arsenatis TaxID=2692265 RepID=A0ABW9Z4E1_9HYPH|nr:TetR/AcrR family transcriptional regulator [Microvirga arsenatis]NBJ13880.1 TetR family transcriptional regulator [Microvirga arsenatis]NBJ27335.1 TetR family transcriptional regulator [Microvirga arsenatis]